MIKRITQKVSKIMQKLFAPLFTVSSYLTCLYYFFSGDFKDEQFAVLNGIQKYRKQEGAGRISYLRRNIHRIEKGLITEPRKLVFAETYIEKTVQMLKEMIFQPEDLATNKWALGVLTQYFDTVNKTEKIKNANKEFIKIKNGSENNLPCTYNSNKRIQANVSYDDILQLNMQRRSVRYYLNKKVPHELIEKAILVALQAPSACNRQPYIFRIVDDENFLKEAVKLPPGANNFSNNIKMMVFVIGDLSYYFDEKDKHLIYIDSSLAVMNFIIALETLGLSSCVINWADIPVRNNSLVRLLKLKKWERCVTTISVGYANPEGGIPSSLKKELQTVVKYN